MVTSSLSLPYPGGSVDDFVFAGNFSGGSFGTYVGGTVTTGPGFADRSVDTLTHGVDGTLYAGGYFDSVGGISAQYAARLRDNTWQAMNGLPRRADSMAVLPNGDVYAALYLDDLHRWDGNTWQPVPAARNNVHVVLALRDGRLLAGGDYLETFDGSTWTPGPNVASVWSAHELPNGDVALASIGAVLPGASVAIWDGINIVGLPVPFPGRVTSLATTPGGDLLVGGYPSASATSLHTLFSWDGTSWHSLTAIEGRIDQLVNLPDGDVLVRGDLTLTATGAQVWAVRWDGQTFVPLAGARPSRVTALACAPDGTIVYATGPEAAMVSFFESDCPADRAELDSGCSGVGGNDRFVSRRWPLIGNDYIADGSGLPHPCFVVEVLGIATTTTLLNSLLPTGQVGCTLHVDPLVLRGDIAAGSYRSTIAIPATVTLIGAMFHHQLVPIRIDAAGNIVEVTASNALSLTVGMQP